MTFTNSGRGLSFRSDVVRIIRSSSSKRISNKWIRPIFMVTSTFFRKADLWWFFTRLYSHFYFYNNHFGTILQSFHLLYKQDSRWMLNPDYFVINWIITAAFQFSYMLFNFRLGASVKGRQFHNGGFLHWTPSLCWLRLLQEKSSSATIQNLAGCCTSFY